MSRAILTINAGSSSIKFALYALDGELARHPYLSGQIDGLGAAARLVAKSAAGERIADDALAEGIKHAAAFDALLGWLDAHQQNSRQIVAVGHRVVHGGERYSQPVRLDAETIAALEQFVALAPLHQPHNLNGVKALAARLPGVPQIACFDTAFHRTQPALAQLFAIPRALTAEGVRRYGFHGLSYEYIARVLPEHSARADGRVVVAHLGNGASMCAMRGLRSQATSMGFTAIDGLMMGTRTGALDPGVVLYLMQEKGMDAKAIEKLLYKESGLLGVSGISQDMRTLLASDDPHAAEAVDLFCYRIVREIGALAACIGGIDALVFTGGIGEHATEVRQRVCAALGWLGIELDPVANGSGLRRISTAGSRTEALAIPTDEEWMIAQHTRDLL
ncbi:acetate/propionate family kinase [Azospira restricta]|uniref:Acetate kinase n=1 Tax=Azospira restricta TaxID=404405 RepID=A0A974SNK8_9RHOO|nr:acetate/propionate family kinase [Azospira restricta]QRJ63218.1 acetate/propionate family kinase [Azospira restricta]